MTSLDAKLEQLFNKPCSPLSWIDSINGVNVYVKKDYLNHALIQGNKLRKLKYNLYHLATQSYQGLITFGGAYSNHIYAVAAVGQVLNIKTIGLIRGQELADSTKWGQTLQSAHEMGMRFHFLSRQAYRQKQSDAFVQQLVTNYSDYYLLPEGGSNDLAVQGCVEIIEECYSQLGKIDVIIAACGTGGTLAGLIDGVYSNNIKSKVIGIPVLKGAKFLYDDIAYFSQHHHHVDWELALDYHFGGYGKYNAELLKSIETVQEQYHIATDPVYTAKLFYAATDLIKKGMFTSGQNIVIYHSGGLQGVIKNSY